MASSSTHSFRLLLLFPLLLLLSTVGSAQTPPVPEGAEKYQQWCRGVIFDSPSCIKVIESIPGIQEVPYNDHQKVAQVCLHFAANKTTEAKGSADTLLAAAKGKPSHCLKVCAADIKSVAEVLVHAPSGQDNADAYVTFIKGVRAKFEHEVTKFEKDKPAVACEKDCWNKTAASSSADETSIVDKFHDIWNVMKVANEQINRLYVQDPDEDLEAMLY